MAIKAPELVASVWADGFRPDPELSVAEWSNTHVKLTQKSSAEPGKFRTDRTPYVVEILEALSPSSPVERVVWMAGAQVAKSQSGFNWIGAVIDQWPGPMLMVQPTVDLAKKVSKQRIAPMIQETDVLRKKVADPRARDSSNTMFEKEFPGGILILTGANSASGLRSMPIRFLFCDEIDAYPQDVENEGSPLDLAEKRTTTFRRRKVLLTSTPTIKGFSAVEREFDRSDKRYFYVPCPHCGEHDTLRMENLVWDEGQPDTARMLCKHCGCLIDEHAKSKMLAEGEWRATAIGDGTRGYHLNALYSPWKKWREVAREFLSAKGSPEKLKVFVNTVLAETWEEKGDGVDAVSMRSRIEEYKAEVPAGAKLLTCAVDVQGDRLEVKVKGWGAKEESWLVAYTQLHGDPARDDVWNELDDFISCTFSTEAGGAMRIDTTVIDSGGHHTDAVYKFCKARIGRRVYPIKGHQLQGKEIVGRASYNNRYRLKMFVVGVDAAKELVQSRMRIQMPGPGYMHLPSWTDEEYLAQLTAEKSIRKYIRGRGTVREWVKTRERNEAFDLEVYSLVALYTRGSVFLNNVLGTRNPEPTAMSNDDSADDADVVSSSGSGKVSGNKWGMTGSSWVNGWR